MHTDMPVNRGTVQLCGAPNNLKEELIEGQSTERSPEGDEVCIWEEGVYLRRLPGECNSDSRHRRVGSVIGGSSS